MRDDLKAAFRSLRSSKDVTLAALIVLTLGIGATTAIFSVVDAVVLRALPFDEHDRLVAVGERRAPGSRTGSTTREPDALGFVAPQNYMDWAAQQRVFESIAAIASGWLTLREPGVEPESLVPQRVTARFFDVLRVPAGRRARLHGGKRSLRPRSRGGVERRVVAASIRRRSPDRRPHDPARRCRGGRGQATKSSG